MPQKPGDRNYKHEYARDQASPTQRKRNDQRKKARRAYEKAHGDQPASKDVAHIKAVVHGGTEKLSNLALQSQAKNRGFSRGKANRPRK
jgi:hypothetical protein